MKMKDQIKQLRIDLSEKEDTIATQKLALFDMRREMQQLENELNNKNTERNNSIDLISKQATKLGETDREIDQLKNALIDAQFTAINALLNQ